VRAGTTAQAPTAPTRLQASHAPPQDVPQHTPSAQKPLAHSPALPQAWPAAFTGAQALSPPQK